MYHSNKGSLLSFRANVGSQGGSFEHVSYDAISASGILDANQKSFGKRVLPTYNFEKAKTVVSFGADFLGNWLNALQTTQLKNTEHQYIEEIPADLDPLLEEIGRVYMPYLCKNVDAVRSGKKYFE